MADSASVQADIAELQRLIRLCERPSVRTWLENQAGVLQSSLSASKSQAAEGQNAPAPAAAPANAIPALAALQPAAGVTWLTPKYGWEQDNQHVTVLVYDLPGVSTVRESVTCSFERDRFDLRVPGLDGKQYRLRIPALEKEIQPELSSFKVKKSSIELKLRKSGQWDHWLELKAKKGKEGAGGKKGGAEAEDPSASIMNMMKDMYESGDDQTRKIIAEAWSKSRAEQGKKGPMGGMGDMEGLGGM